MGFFSSSNSNKHKKSTSWNIVESPSVYTSAPPALPYRPATVAVPAPVQQLQHHYPQQQPQPHYPAPQNYPQQPYPYPYPVYNNTGNVHPSYSQPLFQQPPPHPPPPQRWHSEPQQQQRADSSSRLGVSRFTNSVMNLADTAMAQVYDDVSARLDDVMTRIDREAVSATEAGLFFCRGGGGDEEEDDYEEEDFASSSDGEAALDRSLAIQPSRQRSSSKGRKKKMKNKTSKNQDSHFAKVELYANSKLPLSLPPLALYMPTWPLLCLAAQYSSQVYSDAPSSSSSSSAEEIQTSADWRGGSTRAMVIKSIPMDHASTIVFAIRGTSSFMDWAVNLKTSPSSPTNFLDDPGNLCHAGFLAVARKMVKPVAARLRALLEEDPGRAAYSLLMTGHSAGGAIAALLYCHMLATAEGTESELSLLAGCFKRIHCVTFGAPPVSLLPLGKPSGGGNGRRRLQKCLFLAFVNEGDPVVRADKAYVKSLLELLTRPELELEVLPERHHEQQDHHEKENTTTGGRRRRHSHGGRGRGATTPPKLPRRRYKQVHWPVPTCTLSNAGRIVVLRTGDPMAVIKGRKTVEERLAEGVVAVTCEEEELRGVIWGDPVSHMMSLYAGRIETLAVAAVMGRR